MRFLISGVLLSLALTLTACGGPEVGVPCAVSECDVQNPPDNANTVCEPAVGCETLLCVGQGQGLDTGNIDEYCTVDCEVNEDCPDGFECQVVATVGSNRDRTMCLKPLNDQ
jgi:hypothetical protein